MVQSSSLGVVEIHRLEGARWSARKCRSGFTEHAQSGAGQDGELGAGVEAVNVFGGIGFGETKLLRFFQRVGKRNSRAFDSRQDVVAGAVENAAELDEFVSGEAFLEAGDDGDASGNRGAECDVSVVLRGPGEPDRCRGGR